MKIVFYLLGKKGFKVLEQIILNNNYYMVKHVVVARDINVENDFYNEIISICKKYKIEFSDRSVWKNTYSDYSIAIGWRWLIDESFSKLIVIHDSILPKYRGFAPLVNMLINSENQIGVSAIFASKEYDKGEIIFQDTSKINYPIKINEAIEIVIKNYINVVNKLINDIKVGKQLKGETQNESLATYSLWRDEDDYLIDWSKDSNYILNFVNALSYPYKGACTYLDNDKLRVLEVEIVEDVFIENRDVGKVIFVESGLPTVVCGKGLIKITKLLSDNEKLELLPIKKFRLKFKNKNY